MANGPAKSVAKEPSENWEKNSGSNSVTENPIGKSGWTVMSETEDGRKGKTLKETLASERGQFQLL